MHWFLVSKGPLNSEFENSAESDTTRPPPVRLGGPSQQKIAESTRIGSESDPTRATLRSSVDSGLRVVPEGAESDTTRASRIRLGRVFELCLGVKKPNQV